jgi:succinate dehydrogenase/fumarate reductase flavoprotein subunit
MGGIEIDKNAHVIDTKGNIIPGLYGAGEVTGSTHGAERIGSCAVTDVMVYGRISGKAAANSL